MFYVVFAIMGGIAVLLTFYVPGAVPRMTSDRLQGIWLAVLGIIVWIIMIGFLIYGIKIYKSIQSMYTHKSNKTAFYKLKVITETKNITMF